MHHISFLQDLAIVMMIAAVVTVVFKVLKQPVVLGYILAGIIIGPHTPPFPLISDEETIRTLSELGVVFLMFSLGLEFSLKKLAKVGITSVIAASAEIMLMLLAGYHLGQFFGWSQMDSVFLGAILSISSTTIIIKALQELGRTKEAFAQVIFGILIVEDILAILMIALLSGFATSGSLTFMDLGITAGRLGAFLGALLVFGIILIPRLLNWVARFRSDEMLLVTVLGLCFGVSLLAVRLGYSVALGAFLIGAIIAEARHISHIESLMMPVRDLFSAVFFVSIGLLIDPRILAEQAAPIAIITAVVVVGKVVSCSLGVFVAGKDLTTSMRVGMGLAQIGEFSFIIAALGLSLRVTSEFLYPVAVAVSALTTLLTPYLMRGSDGAVGVLERILPRAAMESLTAYTVWVGGLGTAEGRPTPASFLRKWGWQISLNLLLVAAIFIAAAASHQPLANWWPRSVAPASADLIKAVLWLAACVLSLPMVIAVVRKWQAFALLVSEISVTHAAAGGSTGVLRRIVSTVVFVAGTGAMLLFILVLSTALLPSRGFLIIVTLIVVATTALLWRTLSRLHTSAQFALLQTLADPPLPRPQGEVAPPLPPLLRDATLVTVTLPEHFTLAGKTIAEIRLRTRTGASIVAIERAGEKIINPAISEELRPKDTVLLLGSAAEVASAREILLA